jgi:hypothetical protein
MKLILTSGCSFTNNNRFNPKNPFNHGGPDRYSWPYYLQKELGEEYKVYNLGNATNDNVSMCRVIFYWIDKLINQEVDSSDIKVIIQWSDPTRESIYIDNVDSKKMIEEPHTFIYWDKYEDERGIFYLTGGFSPPDDSLQELGIFNAVRYWEAEVSWNNIINQTHRWLESWSHLVMFMDKMDIQDNYMSMRNPYSNEAREVLFGAPENNSNIPTKTIWFNNHEILKPYVKYLPIDDQRHYHYKNYNGLLEWTIDNSDNTPPFQESNKLYDEYLKETGNGWGHPSPIMMEKFVKEELIKTLNYDTLFR